MVESEESKVTQTHRHTDTHTHTHTLYLYDLGPNGYSLYERAAAKTHGYKEERMLMQWIQIQV